MVLEWCAEGRWIRWQIPRSNKVGAGPGGVWRMAYVNGRPGRRTGCARPTAASLQISLVWRGAGLVFPGFAVGTSLNVCWRGFVWSSLECSGGNERFIDKNNVLV